MTDASQGYAAAGGPFFAERGDLLPIDPHRTLHVHFGMLLGVEDFRTLDAYHRGKTWHGTAWLHGPGVVWGLGVGLDTGADGTTPTGELRVAPGAAFDALGRELHLAQPACVDLPAWYAAHEDDPDLDAVRTIDGATGAVTFPAHVTIAFDACLDRPVPALSEPCDGGSSAAAYSRVVESVRLTLVPGLAPEPATDRFHRVRLLFGLDPFDENPDLPGSPTASDQEVLATRAALDALSGAERARETLRWMRHFAVLDEIVSGPEPGDPGDPPGILPQRAPAPVVLAEMSTIWLLPEGSGEARRWRLDAADLDPHVRQVLLPTRTIEDLVSGAFGPGAAPEDSDPPSGVVPPGGTPPRIDPASVSLAGETITLTVTDAELLPASVDPRGVAVSALDTADGWISCDVHSVAYDAPSGNIDIRLRDAPGGPLVRLIVRGTGSTPFLGADRRPLAGATGSTGGTAHDGVDFVHTLQGGS